MLHIRYLADGVTLEVIERQLSATKTKTSYWYYNTSNWMKSTTGLPNSKPTMVMDQAQIEWVKTHYMTKATKP